MSHLTKKDRPVVNTLLKVSELLPESKFLISGHTDIIGSYDLNVELSKGRAEFLKTLLVKKGMDSNRIETKWFSYDAPIATNDTEEGRAENRRVVCTVYGLTPKQAEKLALAAKNSKRFYVIKIENDQVDNYVADVLEPKLETPNVAQEPIQEKLELVPEPVPVVNDEQKKKEIEQRTLRKAERLKALKEKQRYFASWSLTDNQIEATSPGFKAVWITEFNHEFNFSYQYKISQKTWFGLLAGYKFRDYKLDNNPIYNWDGNSPELINFSLSTDYEINSIFNLGIDLNYAEDNFIIYNVLDLFLEKAATLGLGIELNYKFLDSKSLSSRLNLYLDYPALGFGDIDPKGQIGLRLGVDTSFKTLFKNYESNVGLVFGQRNFENIQNAQSETYIGIEFKIRNKKWF